MDHVAILNKKEKWLDKIISGEKTIESRWYKFKRKPYENINTNDIIFFKNSGEPITVMASVTKVLFFAQLNKNKVIDILEKYGTKIGVPMSFASLVSEKKCCILIFLDKVKEIEPFNIDKTGFGNMSAWISVDDVNDIKVKI